MKDIKVTVASLKSILADPKKNMDRVKAAVDVAVKDGARMLFCPELMLTGHGAHSTMSSNAETIPDGPLCQEIMALSKAHDLCICVGIAELDRGIVYNSQIVIDRGEYLGLQRKINLSGDEYLSFGSGESLEVFDIEGIRFGIVICYDNHFPEHALALALGHVDLILAPHAARTGIWPDPLTPEFCAKTIAFQQDAWEKVHRARAYDHNLFVLINNAVGSSTDGLEALANGEVPENAEPERMTVGNHPGTLMAVDPNGEVFLRSSGSEFIEEIVTVELKAEQRKVNHAPARNRRPLTMMNILDRAVDID
jgi:predicted amidohydrolase